MSGDDPRQIFLDEAAELLTELETTLLALEDNPDDGELVDKTFRALHTVKGSGAMFGFEAVAAFTHYVENAFDLVRKGKLGVSRELIGIALAARDHIRALIVTPDQADLSAGEALIDKLGALLSSQFVAEGGAPPAKSDGGAKEAPVTWRIHFRLAADSLEMGGNPLALLDELRGLGHCTVTPLADRLPPLGQMNPFHCYLAWDVVLTTEQPKTAIEDVFMFVSDDAEISIAPVPMGEGRLGDILVQRGDVSPDELEKIATKQPRLGQMLVNEGVVPEDRVASALAEQKHVKAEAESARNAQTQAGGSVRVPAERLDGLMDQVGELVIAQARLKQLVATSGDLAVKAVAEEIERLSNGLRDTTMGIRAVPIATLFERFRRLIRDLSRELGKEVQLSMTGEETELDKTVIERLNDPLVHIIRNSMDHGIEPPESRDQAGKPKQGRIQLSASHAGAQVLVKVRDDGKGLDRKRIRAKAEEQGLIAEGAELPDSELFQLIFHPGFSTAQAVTYLSGRGVGMDVVKRTIDALRGSIEIDSVPGQGTEITLRLPLTLAIIDGLLVRVGKGRYVIPLSAVEECVELTPEEDARHTGRNFLNIRGDLVPFLRLREIFRSAEKPDPYQKVVVVAGAQGRVGLVVDQVIGEHQTVIKSLSQLHASVENFSGATILGDGGVALIVDAAHLVDAGQTLDSPRQAS
jgi:two-component system chemotaxis sensor kinase CheA